MVCVVQCSVVWYGLVLSGAPSALRAAYMLLILHVYTCNCCYLYMYVQNYVYFLQANTQRKALQEQLDRLEVHVHVHVVYTCISYILHCTCMNAFKYMQCCNSEWYWPRIYMHSSRKNAIHRVHVHIRKKKHVIFSKVSLMRSVLAALS